MIVRFDCETCRNGWFVRTGPNSIAYCPSCKQCDLCGGAGSFRIIREDHYREAQTCPSCLGSGTRPRVVAEVEEAG